MTKKTQALDNASNEHLAEALLRLTVKNPELAAEANAELNAIVDALAGGIGEQAKAASIVEETNEKQLTPEQTENLINTIIERCENNNIDRQRYIDEQHLKAHLERKAIEKPEKLWSLNEMERTGGQPEAFDYDEERDEYIFWEFAKELSEDRWRVCYDKEAEKEGFDGDYRELFDNGWTQGNAVDRAVTMGAELMITEEYRELVGMFEDGEIDTLREVWLDTPAKIRRLGKAIRGKGGDGEDPMIFPENAADPIDVGFRVTLRV